MENPIATLTMENGDIIEIELYPEIAPNTVRSFIKLCGEAFYDDLVFHRVINGFMIQGGCPKGNGTGGPGYSIQGEFAANGFKNDLRHERGVLSMARAQDYDSAGSQFFIMHKLSPHLDGSYAAFGKVVKGLEVIDRIAETPTGFNDRPVSPQAIKSLRVDTKGVEYGPPEVIAR